jgi:hypothetical protein
MALGHNNPPQGDGGRVVHRSAGGFLNGSPRAVFHTSGELSDLQLGVYPEEQELGRDLLDEQLEPKRRPEVCL